MLRKVLALLVCFLFFYSCQRAQRPPSKGAEVKRTEPDLSMLGDRVRFVFGFSQCAFEGPWRSNMNREMEQAAREHPEIRLSIANGENRNEKQIADVEDFIRRIGINLLVIAPQEGAALTSAVAEAFDKGIPAIVLDRKVNGEKYSVFIGASNLEIGREAGKYMDEKLGGRGNVVEIQGSPDASSAEERSQGFQEILANYPGIKLVYKQSGDFKRPSARMIMEKALQDNPKIDGVFAHNDEMMIAAYLAAKAAGREQGIVFVGVNGQDEAVSMIRQGLLSATFSYPSGAKEAIENGLKLLRGETVSKNIVLPSIRITKDEALDYKGF